MSQSNAWCLTLNNPTEEEKSLMEHFYLTQDVCTFAVHQIEKGEGGTPHVQGYFQFGKRLRLTQVKKLFGSRAHLEVARGDANSNIAYCTKEEGRLAGPYRQGIPTTQGKRTDIHAFVEAMREELLSEVQILELYPHILAKYPRFVCTTRRLVAEQNLVHATFKPRPGWQSGLAARLLHPADDRTISWYFDDVGASGKSCFSSGFRLGDGSAPFVITGGRHSDIYFAYARQGVVIFDWPRSNEELFPYAVAEAFKNGYFLSTKYESVPVRFTPPHVVVFANFYPDKTKLSADRWDIHVIDNSLL